MRIENQGSAYETIEERSISRRPSKRAVHRVSSRCILSFIIDSLTRIYVLDHPAYRIRLRHLYSGPGPSKILHSHNEILKLLEHSLGSISPSAWSPRCPRDPLKIITEKNLSSLHCPLCRAYSESGWRAALLRGQRRPIIRPNLTCLLDSEPQMTATVRLTRGRRLEHAWASKFLSLKLEFENMVISMLISVPGTKKSFLESYRFLKPTTYVKNLRLNPSYTRGDMRGAIRFTWPLRKVAETIKKMWACLWTGFIFLT